MIASPNDSLRSPAWLLEGLTRSVPGVIELDDGRLAFRTEQGTVFDVPVIEVHEITFPWYYFGGGLKLTVKNTRYRLSFARPNEASDIPGRLLAGAGAAGSVVGLLTAARKVRDIVVARAAGRAWKAMLAGRR